MEVSRIILSPARDERPGIDRLQGLAMHNEHSVGPIGGDSQLGESGVTGPSAVPVQMFLLGYLGGRVQKQGIV